MYKSQQNLRHTVGFWCKAIHKKFLRRFFNIFGLKMMMKSGVGKICLKFLHALTTSFLLLNFDSKYKFSNRNNMVSAWKNFKNIFPRPLFIIIFRPEMLKFHPYSILTGDTSWICHILCVKRTLRNMEGGNQIFSKIYFAFLFPHEQFKVKKVFLQFWFIIQTKCLRTW